MPTIVRPIVRVDDFETYPELFSQIRETDTIQQMIPSKVSQQAESLLARMCEDAYARAIGPYIRNGLRRFSEVKDRPENDVLFMNLPVHFKYREPAHEMNRRIWFSEFQRGITTTAQRRYWRYVSSLGTLAAICEPDVAVTWNQYIAQRVRVWRAWSERQV